MKRKSIDEIIEKRKEYKEKLAYYEMTSDKKKISFFKNRLASLDKKSKSFGITSEKDQYEVLAKLNKESNELIIKIDLVTNEKGELIEKFTAEAEKNQKALLPIHEIIKDNCSKILNDLCPMEKLKEEYRIKKGQINAISKASSLDNSKLKTDSLKMEAAALKSYKQTPFEFMVAEKKSDFFGVQSPMKDKKEAVSLNKKAPIHKKIENSIER